MLENGAGNFQGGCGCLHHAGKGARPRHGEALLETLEGVEFLHPRHGLHRRDDHLDDHLRLLADFRQDHHHGEQTSESRDGKHTENHRGDPPPGRLLDLQGALGELLESRPDGHGNRWIEYQ